MIHVTRAPSLSKAICHALGSMVGGGTCGLLSAACTLNRLMKIPTLGALTPQTRSQEGRNLGSLTHRLTQTMQPPHTPKHTSSLFQSHNISPGKDLGDHLIQTFHFTGEGSEA